MKTNVLEKSVKSMSSFNLNEELKELTTSGIVNFYSKKERVIFNSSWNGERLEIAVYGVYKISWGFYQNSIYSFYKDVKTELGLLINSKSHDEKAEISINTPCFHAIKSSHKTLTLLLRENENLSLNAEVFNAENLIMKNVYLKVEKLNIEDYNKFGYEN
ncbi:hypothetical protein [Polaribacter sp. Hel1_85]|uniref:hypothetical protein n=1 Tax=Polaribacter sp. Hel1_85 TaxID=1250005 RepID=UPI00052BBD3C|nr:hypothetical protein [Polaribacter sp. Hel1_85]KGL62049.1 hypothetical protein PHEL85_1836 [Polaribacter sp. Hel1_85]